jgi:hypothetical protein
MATVQTNIKTAIDKPVNETWDFMALLLFAWIGFR